MIFLSILENYLFGNGNHPELFFLSGEHYMDIKMLDNLKKMNFDLSGHFVLSCLSLKPLVEVGKI